MSRALAFLSCVLLTMTLAACSGTREYTEGVGSELYWSGLSGVTALQDAYVAEVCHQAGLSLSPNGVAQSCNPDARDPNQWFDFVQAGMNDIDQRCDAYLAWLDERKRTSQSVLHEIADVRTATIAIMSVAGAGVEPIAIAASAIGLAADSFANGDSRLLMGLDHSTVQQIVLTSQATFRNTLPRVINNRPAAIYALRLYLRTCTPYAIEAQVNTTMKLYERGGIQALRAAEANPITSGRSVNNAVTPVLASATAPLIPSPVDRHDLRRDDSVLARARPPVSSKTIREIQTALCVRPTGSLGDDGSETWSAIRSYLSVVGKPVPRALDDRSLAWIDPAVSVVVLNGKGSCAAMGYRDAADVARAVLRRKGKII